MNWTWIDVAVIGAAIFFLWSGSMRGVIMTFFELLILTAGVIICTYLYGALSYLFVNFLHTPALVASVVSYIFFFVAMASFLFVVGGKVEMSLNLPPESPVNRWGGMFFGFLRGLLIIWAFFFFLGVIPITPESRQALHESPTVTGIQQLNDSIDSVLGALGSPRAYHTIHPLIQRSQF